MGINGRYNENVACGSIMTTNSTQPTQGLLFWLVITPLMCLTLITVVVNISGTAVGKVQDNSLQDHVEYSVMLQHTKH